MGKLRRFLMLEKARPGPAESAVPEPPRLDGRLSERFAAVEAEPDGEAGTGAGAGAASPTVVDRFAPPPLADAALEATADESERPQLRCLECGADSGRFAAVCSGCGASLRSRAVVRLNRRLWQDERRLAAVEREARRQAQSAEVSGLALQQRARATQEVDLAFSRLVEAQRRHDRPALVRLVAALVGARGRRWSLLGRRRGLGGLGAIAAVVVALIAARVGC